MAFFCKRRGEKSSLPRIAVAPGDAASPYIPVRGVYFARRSIALDSLLWLSEGYEVPRAEVSFVSCLSDLRARVTPVRTAWGRWLDRTHVPIAARHLAALLVLGLVNAPCPGVAAAQVSLPAAVPQTAPFWQRAQNPALRRVDTL